MTNINVKQPCSTSPPDKGLTETRHGYRLGEEKTTEPGRAGLVRVRHCILLALAASATTTMESAATAETTTAAESAAGEAAAINPPRRGSCEGMGLKCRRRGPIRGAKCMVAAAEAVQ